MLNLCPSENRNDTGRGFTVYQIDIERPEGLMTYTGWTSQRLDKRAQDYRREVGRLLKGVPLNRAGGYRAIHLALAAAMLEGWFASIRVVADGSDAEQARALERHHEAQIRAGARLNGKLTEASRQAFRQVVVAHLRRLGLDDDRLHDILGTSSDLDARPARPENRKIEPSPRAHRRQTQHHAPKDLPG